MAKNNEKTLRTVLITRFSALGDVEMTIPAQMRDDIALQVMERAPIYEYGRSGGILLDDDGVYEALKEIVTGGNDNG